MDPLNLMIEDCWLHLFEFLTAREKQVLYHTCTTFQEMLESQKTNWAFDLILPHVMKHLDYPFTPHGRITYAEAWVLRLQLITKLRLVNKSWKLGFDQYFGSHVEQYGEGTHVRSVNDFHNVVRLENFLTVFKDHSGNPFVGRQVTIYASKDEIEEPEPEDANEVLQNQEEDDDGIVNDPEEGDVEIVNDPEEGDVEIVNDPEEDDAEIVNDAEEDWRAMERQWNLQNRGLLMQILPKYGEEIDYLSVYNSALVAGGYCPLLDGLKFLQQVLCNTPNLQRLELRLQLEYYESRVTYTDEYLEAFEDYFEMNFLPELPRLRVLKLYDWEETLENLLLEAYGANLEGLITYTSKISPLAVESMRSLQTLDLFNSNFESAEKILRGLISPLEKLCVRCQNRGFQRNTSTGKFFMIDRFLLAIQHLPLKEIEIYPDSSILKESEPFPFDWVSEAHDSYETERPKRHIHLSQFSSIPSKIAESSCWSIGNSLSQRVSAD